MSETQNTPEEIDPLEQSYQDGSYEVMGSEELRLPQTEVILPVIMPKGDRLVALGDAVFDPETNKMVVSFNTIAGRDIAEFIGTGALAAISFVGHMAKRK